MAQNNFQGGAPPGGGGGQMPGGQMQWMGMPGFMDPSMMQGMMAALQQGQGMPQMPGMQPMQGVPQMPGVPQGQQRPPTPAPVQMPGGQMPGGQMPGGGAQIPGQMPWMGMSGQMPGQMPAQMPGQMQGQMPGFMDPQMMQNMMAAMQQGQGMQPRPGMPNMQAMPGMQPMPNMPGMPAAAPQATPAPSQQCLSTEDAEKVEAIQKCVENLSTVEKEYYTFLWEQSVGDTSECHQGKLEGKAAFDFLSKSQLPREMLKRIWDMTDWRKRHYFLWEDFVVAMKLISASQKKQLVSLDRVFSSCSPTSRDCPEFEGIANAATFKGGAATGESTSGAPDSDLLGGITHAPVDSGITQEAPMPTLEPTPVARSQSPPPAPTPAPAPDLMDLMQGMATSFATSQAPVQQPDAALEMNADTTEVVPPATEDDEWGGFDTALPVAPTQGNDVVPTTAPKSTAADDDWNAFEGSSVGAATTTWNAFDSQVEPTSSPAVPTTTFQDDNDDWGGFGTAPQAATSTIPATSNSAPAPGGNLWAKMSAFDDLLREDDVLPTEEAAPPVANHFDAPPSTETAAPQPPPDPMSLFGSETAVNSSTMETFKADGDDWGDFETSAAPQMPAPVPQMTARPDSADWGDFESSGPNASTEATLTPAITGGNLGLLETAGEDLFGESIKVNVEAGFNNTEDASGDWAAFATPEPPAFVDSANTFAGDEVDTKAPIAPAATMEAFADFGFDDDDVGSTSVLPETKPAVVEPAVFEQGGFEPQWAAFGTATEPEPKVESDVFAVAAAESFPGVGMQPPSVSPPLEVSQEAFADFGFDDDEKVARPPEVSQEAFADFGFDDDNKVAAESNPSPPASLVFEEGEALGTALGSTIPVVAEESWGAFGDDDDFQFSSAPPLPQPAPITPAVSSSAPVGGSSPAPALAVTQMLAQQVAAAEDDYGPIDEEHRRMAEGLAALGLFQEAQQCQARGTKVYRLSEAETRKKEAAAREDFESAIAMRTEIQALVSEIGDNGQLETWRKMVSNGDRDVALEAVSERLRERCQYLVDAASRVALSVAVNNFRSTCPAVGVGTRLAEIPGLMMQQRRAWQMSRAIEAVGASDVLLVLQVLLVCLATLGELLNTCALSLKTLASSDMAQEDRKLICEATEFKNLLRGVSCLRRLQWRFGLSAELFLPRVARGVDLSEAGEDAKRLEELHHSASSRLGETQAAWASIEEQLTGMKLDLDQWEPTQCYEVSAGSPCAVAAERHKSAPLCVLCLLPAAPLGLEAPSDGNVASTLWKKGVWHVQCANFWIRHGASSSFLKDVGISDPFG